MKEDTQKVLSQLSDEELLKEAKKYPKNAIVSAVFIGFLFGIVLFSIFMSTWSMFTLIPLYMAYRLIKGKKYDKADLEAEIKARKLNSESMR